LSRWLTIVFGVLAIGGVFFLFRSMMVRENPIKTVAQQTVPTLDKPVSGPMAGRDGMRVAVQRSVGETRPMFIALNGRAEAARTASVKAQISGSVTAAPAPAGRPVKKDSVLCELDAAGRDARLREATAVMASKDLDYKRAVELAAKGWAAEARVTSTKAALDAAKASYDVARIEMAKTQIRAPFDGVFEKRAADVGDFLSPGDACGTVVELNPMLMIAEVEEVNASQIQVDAAARLRLPDGADASGKVRYLARTADPSTRAYRLEVAIDNPQGRIPVGLAAELRVQVGQGDAHKVPRGLLTQDERGRIGVRYIDVGGIVGFAPADVVDEGADGVWIAGLPHEALLLAEGQPEARPGLRVTPVYADKPPPS
jgi:multidrug efflux system membrane fusion protein